MKRRAGLALGILIAAFVFGLIALFRLRVSQGDLFPAYSSFRADPLGTRVLFESLNAIPGLEVERWIKPIPKMDTVEPRFVLLPGMNRNGWKAMRGQDFETIDLLARRGGRVAIVFSPEVMSDEEWLRPIDPEEKKAAEKKEEKQRELQEKLPPPQRRIDWMEKWRIELKLRRILDGSRGALATAEIPAGLPSQLTWKSDLYFDFAPEEGWVTLYQRGGHPVLVERKLGAGSVVLATDAFFLSNESLHRERQSALLVWLIGGYERLIFCEAHLNVQEDVGIARLARRYGLAGSFFTLVVLALLFVWRRNAPLIPPASEEAELMVQYRQTAGLEALLRRAVKPEHLFDTCLNEWKSSARPGLIARAESAEGARAGAAAQRYNATVQAIKRR